MCCAWCCALCCALCLIPFVFVFVRRPHHRYDMVMTDHLKPRGSRNTALLTALQALTGNPPIVSVTPAGPDAMGLAVLRAAFASDAELIQAGWRTGSTGMDVALCARVMGRLGQPKSVATEQRVLGVLGEAAEACLQAYPSSMQQDEAELQQLVQQHKQQEAEGDGVKSQQGSQQQDSMLQQVRASMLRGLISEKAALEGSREVLKSWQAQLQQLAAAGGSVKPEKLAAIYADNE